VTIVIAFENVGLAYPGAAEILRDVPVSIEAGSFRFVTGPSGAGKSSLLRLLYLGLRPTRGRVLAFGRDVATIARADMPEIRRRIGVVFQDCRLLAHLDVFDNVALPLRLGGGDPARVKGNVDELLDWVGLADKRHALPMTLSGGEQQRVAIARAVIARPELIIADEPTGNVDDAMAARLLYLFDEMHRNGTAVVIATHNAALVTRRPDAAWHLEHGTLYRPVPRMLGAA
jgi:cell division transport system ATP-binding protein